MDEITTIQQQREYLAGGRIGVCTQSPDLMAHSLWIAPSQEDAATHFQMWGMSPAGWCRVISEYAMATSWLRSFGVQLRSRSRQLELDLIERLAGRRPGSSRRHINRGESRAGR